MAANDIIQVINSTGFPIAASCAMFYLCYKQMTAFHDLKDSIDALTRILLKKEDIKDEY